MSKSPALRLLLFALCACGLLSACGPSDRGPNAPQVTDTKSEVPASPVAAPAPDVPSTPAPPTPAAIEDPLLTSALHARFVHGLTLDQARALTAIPAVPAGGDGKKIEIFRWTDRAGVSFTARFDEGALTTKSGLLSPRASGGTTNESQGIAREDLNTMPVAQIAPGVYIPLERAVTSATEQPLGTSEAPRVPDRDIAQREVPVTPPASGPTVAVAGATRRARENVDKTSSYHPHAALPEFARSLEEGSFEIRFLNPSDSPVTAGLRQERLGNNLTVPPRGKASIKVNRGTYQLFFLRDSDPDTLFEAKPLTIDGFQSTDIEVTLDPENVAIHLIDYSKPES